MAAFADAEAAFAEWAATGALAALAVFAGAFAGVFAGALGDDGAAAAATDALVILLGEGDRGDFLRAAELNISFYYNIYKKYQKLICP